MSFFEIPGPGWLQRDPQARREAVRALQDQDVLAEVALCDPDLGVREAALTALKDPDRLARVVLDSPDPAVRAGALRRLLGDVPATVDRFLVDAARAPGVLDAIVPALLALPPGAPDSKDRLQALVAIHSPDEGLARQVVREVSAPQLLLQIAERTRHPKVGAIALARVDDQEALLQMVIDRGANAGRRATQEAPDAATSPGSERRLSLLQAVVRQLNRGSLGRLLGWEQVHQLPRQVLEVLIGRLGDPTALSRAIESGTLERGLALIAALERRELLASIEQGCTVPELARAARERLEDLDAAGDLAALQRNAAEALAAVGRLSRDRHLEPFARSHPDAAVRTAAVAKLTSPETLDGIARSSQDPRVQTLARTMAWGLSRARRGPPPSEPPAWSDLAGVVEAVTHEDVLLALAKRANEQAERATTESGPPIAAVLRACQRKLGPGRCPLGPAASLLLAPAETVARAVRVPTPPQAAEVLIAAPPEDLDDVLAAGGEWIARFHVDVDGAEPPEFRHLFMVVEGDDVLGRGAIVTGQEWDGTDWPEWRVVHGWTTGDGHWYCDVNRLAYLGPTWQPRFADLCAAASASRDEDLERFVTHLGAPPEPAARPTAPPSPGTAAPPQDARTALASGGHWLAQFGAREGGPEIPQFRHLYVAIVGDDNLGKGAIVTGQEWRPSGVHRWRVVHGWTRGEALGFEISNRLTYLGPTWEPRFAAIHDAVFATGGRRLERFVTWTGARGQEQGQPPLRVEAAPPPRSPGPPTSPDRAVDAEAGAWLTRFGVDIAGNEPSQFRHHFVVIHGNAQMARGSIVVGERWDRDRRPKWRVVHGWSDNDGWGFIEVDAVAYLGAAWEPRFAGLQERLFSEGGTRLQRFQTHPSAAKPGSKPPPPTSPAGPAAGTSTTDIAALQAAAGRWVRDFGITIAGPEPPQFRHFYAVIEGNPRMARGAIVTGEHWDRSTCPKWRVVHGWTSGEGTGFRDVGGLAHLGPTWEPRFTDLQQRLFAAGGTRLERFVTHAGAPPAPAPEPQPPPRSGDAARLVDAAALEAAEGRWLSDLHIDVNGPEPPQFRHFFVAILDRSQQAKGAILTGETWDRSANPKWRVVHGWTCGDGLPYEFAHRLTYLGPTWEPRFIAIHDAVFARGGSRLERFVTWSGAIPGRGGR